MEKDDLSNTPNGEGWLVQGNGKRWEYCCGNSSWGAGGNNGGDMDEHWDGGKMVGIMASTGMVG